MIIPPGFFKDHESIEVDSQTTAIEVGYAGGRRILFYSSLPRGHLVRPYPRPGDLRLAALPWRRPQRTMEEAVAFPYRHRGRGRAAA